jgi:small redox-active disulfide protein 2
MQTQTTIKIQVLGSGCTTCKNLYEITKKASLSLGLNADVEYITDITKIVEMGIMTSPVLAVNGKAVMTGYSNDIEKIKELINLGIKNSSDIDKAKDNSKSGCTCTGGCC